VWATGTLVGQLFSAVRSLEVGQAGRARAVGATRLQQVAQAGAVAEAAERAPLRLQQRPLQRLGVLAQLLRLQLVAALVGLQRLQPALQARDLALLARRAALQEAGAVLALRQPALQHLQPSISVTVACCIRHVLPGTGNTTTRQQR